jgi:hypothetical protein
MSMRKEEINSLSAWIRWKDLSNSSAAWGRADLNIGQQGKRWREKFNFSAVRTGGMDMSVNVRTMKLK